MTTSSQKLMPGIQSSTNDGNGSKPEIDALSIKKAERDLIEILTRIGIIHPDYQGEVILHFSQGGLSDIDRFEKSIRRRLEKKFK